MNCEVRSLSLIIVLVGGTIGLGLSRAQDTPKNAASGSVQRVARRAGGGRELDGGLGNVQSPPPKSGEVPAALKKAMYPELRIADRIVRREDRRR